MPNIVLTSQPTIESVEATLREGDASKFDLRVKMRAYVGSQAVEVLVETLDLSFPWTGTYWAGIFPNTAEQTWNAAGYDYPV